VVWSEATELNALSRTVNCFLPKHCWDTSVAVLLADSPWLIWLWRVGNARSKACSIDMHAGAGTAARLRGAAASVANANQGRALVQLPGGNTSRAQNGGDRDCQ